MLMAQQILKQSFLPYFFSQIILISLLDITKHLLKDYKYNISLFKASIHNEIVKLLKYRINLSSFRRN